MRLIKLLPCGHRFPGSLINPQIRENGRTHVDNAFHVSKSKNNFRDFGEGYFHDQYHTQQDLNNVDV